MIKLTLSFGGAVLLATEDFILRAGFNGALTASVFFGSFCHAQAQGLPEINGLTPQSLYTRIKSETFLNDLEAMEPQRRRIEEINARVWEDCRAIPRSATRPKKLEFVVAKGLDEIFNDVLLPHQQIRFVQLVHQDELRRLGGSLSNYLVQPKVGHLVGLADRKAKSLETIHARKVEEIREETEEFRKKVAAILANEEKETMVMLGDEQKKKLTDLIGERNVAVKPGAEAKRVLNEAIQKGAR